MKKLKQKLKRLPFYITIWKSKLHILLNKRKIEKKVGIVSCDQWKGKMKDDILLKCALEQMNVQADIISWQDKKKGFTTYDALIVTTIWGFHRHLTQFYDWLKQIENHHILILNEISLMKDNFDKEKQFELLRKYHIKCVDTVFIEPKKATEEVKRLWEHEYSKYPKIVVKPTISESGNDTYVLGEETSKNSVQIEQLDSLYQNVKGKLMVQPFIEEVQNGELSLILIDGKLTNVMLRYPNIFTKDNQAIYIDIEKLDQKLLTLAHQILKIPEYQDFFYMRIDTIKSKGEYQIMEVELLDPNLYLSFIPNKKQQKETFHFFAESILKRIDKNQKRDKMKS